jgi:integrase
VTDHGQRLAFTIHADSRSEAEAQLRYLLQQRDDHTLPVDKTTTLAQWMGWWVEHANLRDRVRQNDRYAVTHHVTETWLGNVRLARLEPEHLERYYTEALAGQHSTRLVHEPVEDPHPDPRRKHPKTIAKRVPRPLSATTVRNLHAIIRTALNMAVRRRRIAFNPAERATPPSPDPRTIESLTEEQAQAVLAAAQQREPWIAARWTLGLLYGCRPSEVLGIGLDDVHPDHIQLRQQAQPITGRGMVVVPYTKTSASRRDIPTPDPVAGLIRKATTATRAARLAAGPDWIGANTLDEHTIDLLFCQPDGRPITPPYDTRIWHALLDEAGVPRERRYVARHTAASLMLAMGWDIATIAAILGHRRASYTLDLYVHPLDEEKRRAAEGMARRLLG